MFGIGGVSTTQSAEEIIDKLFIYNTRRALALWGDYLCGSDDCVVFTTMPIWILSLAVTKTFCVFFLDCGFIGYNWKFNL